MSTTWTDSFPDLSDWTQDPHNGVITPGASSVTVSLAYPLAGQWEAAAKLAPNINIPLADLGLDTLAALVVVEVEFVTGTGITAGDVAGIALWEADTDAYRLETWPGIPAIMVTEAVANVFAGTASTMLAGFPALLQLVWNNSGTADTTDQGDPIPDGDIIAYASDDGGATWSIIDQRALGVAPTHLTLFIACPVVPGGAISGEFQAVSVSIPHHTPSAPSPEPVTTPDYPGRPYGLLVNDAGDLEVDDYGQLMRDYSVATRARIHLLTRRGEYWADPTMGSRFHLLKLLKDARAKVQAYAEEALLPMVRDGSIISVEATEVEELVETGQLACRIAITVAEGEAVQLGLIPLGAIA